MNYDILGTLYAPVVTDDEGEIISGGESLQGFHINTTAPLEGLDEYLVTPTTPRQVFAGVPTYFYTFPDEAFWLSLGTTDEYGNWTLSSEYIPTSRKDVPSSVTKRQGRQQLILMGMLEAIEVFIASIEDPVQKALSESFWNDSSQYEREHPQMIALSQALGMTSEQLDEIFIEAAKL